jgi:hypothetical protein
MFEREIWIFMVRVVIFVRIALPMCVLILGSEMDGAHISMIALSKFNNARFR